MTPAQMAIRGTISFVQTCNKVPQEYLLRLVSGNRAVEVPLCDAPAFIRDIASCYLFSVLLPSFRGWRLDVNMAIPKGEIRWTEGIDILPLLKAVDEAQAATRALPHATISTRVGLNNAGYRHIHNYLGDILHPTAIWLPRRAHLFRSVEQILVRNDGSTEFFVIVLKDHVLPPVTEDERKVLVRSLGFGENFDYVLYLAYRHVTGRVGRGVDLVTAGPNARRLRKEAMRFESINN